MVASCLGSPAVKNHRRTAAENRRGNGALRKLGATPEGVLRRSFLWHGKYHDQVLWSILDSDWTGAAPAGSR